MDEFAGWGLTADDLSPEVQAGLRRAFEIAHGRQSGSVDDDDLVLGLLKVRAHLGIAWVGAWPVDVAYQISRLRREQATEPPTPSYAARATIRRALEEARAEGESRLDWEHAAAACGQGSSKIVYDFASRQEWPHSWRSAVASLRRTAPSCPVPPGHSDGAPQACAAQDAAAADQVLTLQDAAELLSVHVQTLRDYMRQGRLRAYRIAGERALRVMRADVLALLEAV